MRVLHNTELNVDVREDGMIFRDGVEMNQNIGWYGYRRVFAVAGRTTYVHRLVAQMFCEKPDGCEVVDHIDGNVSNNAATNLKWTTREANSREGNVPGRRTYFKQKDPQKSIIMRVPEDTWHEWNETAEKSGFVTLTSFIRHIMSNECAKINSSTA